MMNQFSLAKVNNKKNINNINNNHQIKAGKLLLKIDKKKR